MSFAAAGTLLGSVSGGVLDVTNCFGVPFHDSSTDDEVRALCCCWRRGGRDYSTLVVRHCRPVADGTMNLDCPQVQIKTTAAASTLALHKQMNPSEVLVGWYVCRFLLLAHSLSLLAPGLT